MKKVGIILAPGFEEGEVCIIIDVLRRQGIICNSFSLDKEEYVKGMHNILVKTDKILNSEIREYDMIVLPGGRPGGPNLIASSEVISLVKHFDKLNKYVAAMCFGTRVLEAADIIQGRKVTGYKGYENFLVSGNFTGNLVEADQNLITSQGPATAYPFAYKICEVLGYNPMDQKERVLYNFVGGR